MVKNSIKFTLLVLLAVAILPTGDPFDILLIPLIIDKYGYQAYLMVVLVTAFLLYRSIEGKTIKQKINNVKKELGRLWGGFR